MVKGWETRPLSIKTKQAKHEHRTLNRELCHIAYYSIIQIILNMEKTFIQAANLDKHHQTKTLTI